MNAFRSSTTPRFRECFTALPADMQEQASKQYAVFAQTPFHPSLRLKQIGPYWSVRVSRGYRALAVREGALFTWFWIGSHDEYERLMK